MGKTIDTMREKNIYKVGTEMLRLMIQEAVNSSITKYDDSEYVNAEEVVNEPSNDKYSFDSLVNRLNTLMSLHSWKFRVRYQNNDAKFGKNEFFGGQGDDEGDKVKMQELLERLINTARERRLIYIIVSAIKGYNTYSAKPIMAWGNVVGRWLTQDEIAVMDEDPLRFIDFKAKGIYIHPELAGSIKTSK